MTAQVEPEIILYDLACTKGICFSPAVWRIRLMLNYKRIPYKTVFLEFPEIGPTLKKLGLTAHAKDSPGYHVDYTVPAIHHLASNQYIMDSPKIAAFLEQKYPNPPVPLTSELGTEVQGKVGPPFYQIHRRSLSPREVNILSPSSQDYFRGKLEPTYGHPLEDLLADPKEEEANWAAVQDSLAEVNELLRTNEAEGPFILGKEPSFADFALAGSLQFGREIDENVFQRVMDYPRFRGIYEACSPWMERKD